MAYRCEVTGGEARVNDDESLDVRYFPIDQLPEMRADHRRNIEVALRDEPAAVFLRRPAQR